MNTMKKLALILIIILASSSGLLFGCQALYSRMKLTASVEEITLYLVELEEEPPLEEPPLEEGELVEEQVLNTTTFTATIENLPKNVSNNILVNMSIAGIIKVEQTEKDNENNTTTFQITALKPGNTVITLKTEEGAKTLTIPVSIIEPIQNLEANEAYQPMVVLGEQTNISVAQALKFTPATTNQKEVVYSLVGEVEGVEVTESGFVTVSEKTADFITVRATSVADSNLYTDILVKVIQPILPDNILLLLGEEEVEKVELSSNIQTKAQQTYQVVVGETTEVVTITLQANTNKHIDIEKLSADEFQIRSIQLGQTTLSIIVSVYGYEGYSVVKQVPVEVLEFPTYVSINNESGIIENKIIFDQYVSTRGAAFNLKVGAIGSYDKRMILQLSEEDAQKIEISYSDGTPVDIVNDILPNNVTIYIKAKVDELGQIGNFASLTVLAYASLEEAQVVQNTLNMTLKRGAQDLVLTSPVNDPPSFSIQQGEFATISFEALPEGASLGEVNLYAINSGIVQFEKQSATQFKITGLNAGNTRLTLVSSNGINKNIEVSVYVPLTDVTLNLPSPSENTSVASRNIMVTENEHQTLSNITLSVGTGLALQVVKYPTNANTISTTYQSSSPNIASISASGYIVAKALGITTITVTTSYLHNLGSGESEVREIVRTFTLTVYMPIVSTQLNYYQATLFDANTLGFSERYKSKLQLNLNINPANATFNQSSIVWSANSSFATVSSSGLVEVQLPAEINSATVVITATIQEYNRYYTQRATITVQKPIKVNNINILNVQDRLYFDARDGLGVENKQTTGLLLNTRVYPINASNATLTYRFIEDMNVQPQLGLTNEEKAQPVVIIEPNGLIIPNRVGSGVLHVIAQDSYTTSDVYTQYVEIPVRVADGVNELRAIEISSAQDFLNINTPNGLSLHYVLSKTIDLTGASITPIGLIDGIDYGFSGVISGDFTPFGYPVENQIIGANMISSSTSRNNYIGLFSSLTGNGQIKNVTVQINQLSLVLSNNASSTSATIGGLVGRIRSGVVSQVKVNLVASDISLATRTNYVGGIAGHVDTLGRIEDSFVWGQLNVAVRQNLVSEPLIYMGGQTGYNLGQLSGGFVADGANLLDNFANYNANLRIILTNSNNTQSALGGLVGYNASLINGLTSNASVQGQNNVGGAIGVNASVASNMMASGFVTGVQNVGGLIGLDQGTIEKSTVLIFDQFALDAVVTPQIVGQNNVGGLVGSAVNSTISYSYVRSFYTRAVDDTLYSGDLFVSIAQNQVEPLYVGGLIGKVQTANLNTVYAHLNVNVVDPNATNTAVYAGGLIGGNTELLSLQNAYTKGTLKAENNATVGGVIGLLDYNGSTISFVYAMNTLQGSTVNAVAGNILASVTVQNSLYLNTIAAIDPYATPVTQAQLEQQETYVNSAFSFVSLGGAPFAIDATLNEGTAYMMYANNIIPMLIQVPTDIQIAVTDGITSQENLTNNHFKIDNKKAVVFYYENAQGNLNTYSLDNTSGVYGSPIIQKVFTPSNISVSLINFISSAPNVVRVLENGLLEVLGEGVTTITAYSILDKNVYDEFELAVVKPITHFNLLEEDIENSTLAEITTETQMTMKVGDKKRIYPQLFAQIGEDGYTSNAYANLYYTTSNPTSISMDGFDWAQDGFYTTIFAQEAQVIRADYARYGVDGIINTPVTVTPSITIAFEETQETLLLQFLQKEFGVRVVEGSRQLTTPTTEANITPKDLLTLDVTLQTDIPTTLTEPYTSVTAIKSVERVVDTTQEGIVTQSAESELFIQKVRMVELGSEDTIVDRYTIEIADKLNKTLYGQEQTYIITFASYDVSINGVPQEISAPALTRQLILTVIPQDVLRIDANFYPSNEVFENSEGQFYNPNELPANFIMAGKIGLLKLGVYPEYANADYIDLTYTSNRQNTMSLEQVAYVFEENDPQTEADNVVGYTAIYPQAEAIERGIRLRLKSNRGSEIPSSGGLYNYTYDGNLYVRVLIGTEVGNDTTFTLTAVAYNAKTETPSELLRTSLALTVEPASQLEIAAGTNKLFKYTPIGVETELTISVSKLNIANPEDEIEMIIPAEFEDIITVSYVETLPQNGFLLQYKYHVLIEYSETFDFNITIPLQAQVERIINNNSQLYKSNVFTIRPALFTIEAIKGVANVQESGVYNVAFGGTYPLNLILQATYYEGASNVEDIEAEILALQAQFSEHINDGAGTSTWYSRLYGSGGTEDTMLQIGSYPNYAISKDGTQVNIEPRRVSEGDILVAKIQFQYSTATGIPEMQTKNLEQTLLGFDELKNRTMEFEFTTNFYLRTQEDKPVPIYDVSSLKDMQEGGHYILMEHLTLTDWVPLTTNIASLDGNSKTITIMSFQTEETITTSTKNYGLFAQIGENTILKNMSVLLDNVILDATQYQEVTFGGLVAQNNGGIIYNSSVTSSIEAVQIILTPTINQVNTVAYIGGLVGQNSGTIVNSRSEVSLQANKGYLAGLAANNTGVITSSYYKNGQIKNTSLTKLNSAVAGLVVFNGSGAKIMMSYVEGNRSQMEIDSGNITGRIIGGGLEFSGDLAAFVFENQGNIANSYANIRVAGQSRSSGFVFNNMGVIQNSHSMSKVAYNVAAHTPFIGTSEQGVLLNSGSVTGSYYLKGDFANASLQPAMSVILLNWQNKLTFETLSFSEGVDEYYGIWKMDTLTNPNNASNTVLFPSLVSANHIALSSQTITHQTTNEETQETEYEYGNVYAEGSFENPLIIRNKDQFNQILTEQGEVFNQYVRIIKNITFDPTTVVSTSFVNFAGVLDGNGLSLNRINVITSSQTQGNSIGLFKTITTDAENVGLVKNINLQFDEVFANEKTYVGALAGVIDDGYIYDVSVSGAQVVQGKHIVGGLAGKVIGSSHLVNINVNISVNSSYRQSVYSSVSYDIYTGQNIDDEKISYAGAIAGIVDVDKTAKIENIFATNSSVLGENVGGAFGLVGKETSVNNVKVEVVKDQLFRTTKVVGGIVGENRGTIKNSIISHSKNVQETIDDAILLQNFGRTQQFQNTSLFVGIGHSAGGAVGLNNGGTINNVQAKIDVRNKNIDVAGGLVGRMLGGNIYASIARGSVSAKYAIGGLIGSIANREILTDYTPTFIKTDKSYLSDSIPNIFNAYAYNNWLREDYNYIISNVIIGGFIGIIQTDDMQQYNEQYFKNNYIAESNFYINSIYSPEAFTSLSLWHLIFEIGAVNNGADYVYEESNKPTSLSYSDKGEGIYYASFDDNNVNSNNVAAMGKKIFETSYFNSIKFVLEDNAIDKMYVQNNNKAIEPPMPEKEGYNFYGWYTNSAYLTYFNWDTVITSDITLYAWWQAKTYDVLYNANGGINAPVAQIKTHDVTLNLSEQIPTKEGYDFLYWNDKLDGTGATYYPGDTYTDNIAITLYAQWQAKTYDVLYNANGGINAPVAQIKTHDVTLNLSEQIPIKTGYDFLYWNDKLDGTGVTYYPGDTYTHNIAIILYAQWEVAEFQITLDRQGGTGGTEIVLVEYGQPMPSATKPVRIGYNFQGYYEYQGGGGIQFYTSNMNSATAYNWLNDRTIYAYWTPDSI
jgi:hypothetical protein